jgi:hypothetical protein
VKKTWISTFGFVILMVTAVAWAAPVPDTGQMRCYDNFVEIPCPASGETFYGQDGNYDINPLSYTKLDGSGGDLPLSATSWVMVRDNVTGLTWEMKNSKDGIKDYTNTHDADNVYTWYDSNTATNGGDAGTPGGTPGDKTDTEAVIKDMNDAKYGGYDDWRMPTIKELAYIVKYNIPSPGPTIYATYFSNTPPYVYWSSSSSLSWSAKNAWGVDFSSGYVHYGYAKTEGHYVRAVRGRQSGSDDAAIPGGSGGYINNGDGTVTDTYTYLTWDNMSPPSSAMTWAQGLAYCEGLSLGGSTDWRLPTQKELHSLVDYNSGYSAGYPTIKEPFGGYDGFYWSSTTYASYAGGAWGVNFSAHLAAYGFAVKTGSYYVRAVRGGQAESLNDSVLSVSPTSRDVAKDAGTITFSVSNTGTETIMPWTAAVTLGGSWLSIVSGASGTDSGTINCSFTANTRTSARTATIRVTAPGATDSLVYVTVTQAGVFAGSLAVSFDSLGIWIYSLGNAAWMQLSSVNPENMISSGSTIYVGFGASYGLYKWDGAAWTQLTTANPENMVTFGSNLYVDFGASFGLWRWDGAAWAQLTPANPENMAASGSMLYVDFGTLGLYYWDGAAWSQLTGFNPAIMTILN